MSGAPQQVNISDLDLSSLAEVKRQLEEVLLLSKKHIDATYTAKELSHLTNSLVQLKQAQSKFKSCIENVAELKPQNQSAWFGWSIRT